MSLGSDKFILDACCGGRMFWFDKHQPNTVFIDNNPRGPNICKDIPNFEVNPDEIMDFRDLKYPDKSFKLVVWDPPHLKTLTETSIMRKKFGCLNTETWRYDLAKGFSECWRVLDDYGVLVFKWYKGEISQEDVLALFKKQPLFGHTTGSKSKTMWFCFMRIPTTEGAIPPKDESLGILAHDL